MEDPTLAGAVLQRANSAYYRASPEPIESLDRAVFMLGTDGLRSLMAGALLQPVFRIPRGPFEKFADITWEQAERTAIAAEVNARTIGDAEPIVAQLLGRLSLLANIVLFRLTMDKYREQPHLTPRAEVLIEAIRMQRACMASLIAPVVEDVRSVDHRFHRATATDVAFPDEFARPQRLFRRSVRCAGDADLAQPALEKAGSGHPAGTAGRYQYGSRHAACGRLCPAGLLNQA
jgi:hypothetical protein